MKIRWLQNCEVEVGDENTGDAYCETRESGDIDDNVEIKSCGMTLSDGNKLHKDESYPILRFGDSGLLSVPVYREWFEVIG